MKNFTLDSFKQWADRLRGSKDKDNWERVFTPGKRLWAGLTAVYECIEHYGTGGGLCRPIFAEFLNEAADALGDTRLRELARRYEELGRGWTDLANTALHSSVPIFRKARQLYQKRSELRGCGSPEKVRAVWNQLGELAKQAADCFPLSEAQADALRADLQKRVRALYDGESAALQGLNAACA